MEVVLYAVNTEWLCMEHLIGHMQHIFVMDFRFMSLLHFRCGGQSLAASDIPLPKHQPAGESKTCQAALYQVAKLVIGDAASS